MSLRSRAIYHTPCRLYCSRVNRGLIWRNREIWQHCNHSWFWYFSQRKSWHRLGGSSWFEAGLTRRESSCRELYYTSFVRCCWTLPWYCYPEVKPRYFRESSSTCVPLQPYEPTFKLHNIGMGFHRSRYVNWNWILNFKKGVSIEPTAIKMHLVGFHALKSPPIWNALGLRASRSPYINACPGQ